MNSLSVPAPVGTQEALGAHRLVRRLAVLYAIACLLAATPLLSLIGPGAGGSWRGPVVQTLGDGTALMCLGPALLCTAALLCSVVMTRGRWRAACVVANFSSRMTPKFRRLARLGLREASPGRLARAGQGTLVPLLCAGCAVAVWRLVPGLNGVGHPPGEISLLPAAVFLCGAFPALVAERAMAATPTHVLPEARALRRLLLLPALGLPLAALTCFARAAGIPGTVWAAEAVSTLLLLVLAELALRALRRWFVPAPSDAAAEAAVDSLILAVLCGAATGQGPGEPIRSHFGLDFSRSWALVFFRAAALPMLLLTGAICWGLAGVSVLKLDQRGVYERLGAPVAVLGPGVHLVLPWPFGRVRPVELGVVHAIALGSFAEAMPSASSAPVDVALTGTGLSNPTIPIEPYAVGSVDASDPEAPAPASADRLWGAPHPAEAEYLIASAGASGQNFQTVSADLRVLYRVGASDADARAALYAAADPEIVVRTTAGRLITRFFAARTLDAVLARPQDDAAAALRDALSRSLREAGTGLEVVAVVIEAIHPPAGAADAYHGVQAAEIAARTQVAAEQGRARGIASGALEEAHRLRDVAEADEGERIGIAHAEAERFAADRAGDAAGGRAFRLERYFADLASALARAPLTVVDHRLGAAGPVIDLRTLSAPATGAEDPD